jgi:polysaccharide export outer membrane protein
MQYPFARVFSWLIIPLMVGMVSCNNRAIMFKTKKNYPYDDFSTISASREYKIGLNDILDIQIIPNKGALLIEGGGSADQSGGGGSTSQLQNKAINTVVEFDGTTKLPMLGRIQMKDLSVREAELMLEERLKQYYVDPYVTIKITNKRIVMFPGEAGNARVINLQNQNTTLLEALALSGGVSANGKANRIKLIRGDLKNPQVYLIDLSTIDGMKKADMTLQGNDIIYIEPRNDFAQNFISRATPYLYIINLSYFYLLLFN